jgi:hypothetical protein
MTADDWRDRADPHQMLVARRGLISDRRLRLFACACAARTRALLGKGGWKLVRTAEDWADGLADGGVLGRAVRAAQREAAPITQAVQRRGWPVRAVAPLMAYRAALSAAVSDPEVRVARSAAAAVALHELHDQLPHRGLYVTEVEHDGVGLRHQPSARGPEVDAQAEIYRLGEAIQEAWWAERQFQADLLRCVVPPPQFDGMDPRFMTSDVVGLARGIDEDRAYDRMPLLGDSLMDAGCDDEQLLAHARADGHVRGCWLVDLVLGKE